MTTWTHLIKIERLDESLFQAESDSAPNCFAFGDSADEARTKMATIISDLYEVLSTGRERGDLKIVEVVLPKYSSKPLRFIVQLCPEDEGGFGVTCAFLNGCASVGETEDEALEMIRDAIDTYTDSGSLDSDVANSWHYCLENIPSSRSVV